VENIDTWNGGKNVIRGQVTEKNSFLKMLDTSQDDYGWDSYQQAYDYDDDSFDGVEEEVGRTLLQDRSCALLSLTSLYISYHASLTVM
jgi:hypothetical protein